MKSFFTVFNCKSNKTRNYRNLSEIVKHMGLTNVECYEFPENSVGREQFGKPVVDVEKYLSKWFENSKGLAAKLYYKESSSMCELFCMDSEENEIVISEITFDGI